MNPSQEILVISVFTAAACSVAGVFLVLRKMSMAVDSISHTILLGIVLGFMALGSLSSPILFFGAAAVGTAAVWLIELLVKSRLVSEDSATGIIFPLFFSFAVILITQYAGSVHLDIDSVILGELAFAPFDRMVIEGADIGAKGIYISGGLLILNVTLISMFFKELTLASFDPVLAYIMGFSPILIHYCFMTAVCITAVGAFETAGSLLVTAFMIAPASAAYLLTDNLKHMIFIALTAAVISAVLGFHTAMFFDISISGSMACFSGLALVAAATVKKLLFRKS